MPEEPLFTGVPEDVPAVPGPPDMPGPTGVVTREVSFFWIRAAPFVLLIVFPLLEYAPGPSRLTFPEELPVPDWLPPEEVPGPPKLTPPEELPGPL